MKMGLKLAFVLVVAVLVLALSLQLAHALQPLARTKPPHLKKTIPDALDGFAVHDEPLGPTEVVADEVTKTLNYDDYVNRVYQRGDLEIGVYVAYWGAGKMPTRDIASHTPDRCWTKSGMTCQASRFHWPVAGAEDRLLVGQWREFTSPHSSRPIWVYFWLLSDGESYDFGTDFNAQLHLSDWLASVWKNTRHVQSEHYFIRLTSNQPFEKLTTEQAYQTLLNRLAELGLAVRASGTPKL